MIDESPEQAPTPDTPSEAPSRPRRPRRRVAAFAAGAAVLVGGGVAVAATQQSSPQARNAAIAADAAARLGVKPDALTAAVKQALIDQVNKALAAGEISKTQADAMKARIQAGNSPLFGVGGYRGGPGGWGGGFGHHGFGGHRRFDVTIAAATYLRLTPQQLFTKLQAGKTLAQVAVAQGATVAGLKHAITAAVTAELDAAVSAGRITKTQETMLLKQLAGRIDRELTSVQRFEGPPGGPAPGTFGGPPAGSGPAPAGPAAGGFGAPA
jgi:hypothetical protein